jgi:phage shock protein E
MYPRIIFSFEIFVYEMKITIKKYRMELLAFRWMKNIEELIRSGKATIVDVRTPVEFMGGHVEGSINIPLQDIPKRIKEFKTMSNIILCCASGARSGQASLLLKQNGIECENAGSWLDVNCYC